MTTTTINLVCTPEQASELKALGVSQSSTFYFLNPKTDNPDLFIKCELAYISILYSSTYSGSKFDEKECIASAFTVTELAPVIKSLARTSFQLLEKHNKKYKGIREVELIFSPEYIADCVLSGLEQKAITIDQVNKMLIK